MPDSPDFTDRSPLGENPELELIDLIDGRDFLRINPIGNRINRLSLSGVELLISPTRGDGNVASTHICIPRLGQDDQYSLKQHGESRSAVWGIQDRDNKTVRLEREISEGNYPPGLEVSVRHILDKGVYRIETTLVNNGSAQLPTLVGWHLYWNGLIEYRSVNGLKLNDTDISDLLVPSSNTVELAEENTVEYPQGPKVRLIQTGFPNAVLWVGANNSTVDRNYFCLEPVQGRQNEFGTRPETQLCPGQGRELSVTLSVL